MSRTLWRIARRSALGSRRRSVLVVALIALPVAIAIVMAIGLRTGRAVRGADGSLWSEPSVVAVAVAAVLSTVVAAVAAAAFATGTRQRLHEYGVLVAGAGASPAHVRGVVLREAGVLGIVGAASGIVLGVVGSIALRPLLESIEGRPVPSLSWHALDLLAPAVVGLLAALAAAYVPARTVARVPVTAALGGRTPTDLPPRWLVPLAGGATVVGLGLYDTGTGSIGASDWNAPLVAVGAAMAVAGVAALASPLVARIARGADRLPLLPRLVVRDAARQRTRSAAAVAALTVVFVPAVVLATLGASNDAVADRSGQNPSQWRGRGDLVVLDAGAIAPAAPALDAASLRAPLADLPETQATHVIDVFVDRVQLPAPGSGGAEVPGEEDPEPATEPMTIVGPGETGPAMGAAGPELFEFLQVPAPPRGTALITDFVLADGVEIHDGPLTFGPIGTTAAEPTWVAPLDLVVPEDGFYMASLPELLISRETLATLPAAGTAGTVPSVAVVDLVRRPTQEELQASNGAADGVLVTAPGSVPVPPPWTIVRSGDVRIYGGHAAEISLVLMLAIVIAAMTTARTASESDGDLDHLAAVGADPRLRRSFHGLQAGFHTLLAVALAAPVGLALAPAILPGFEPTFRAPWATLAFLFIGAPLIVGLAVGALRRPSSVTASADASGSGSTR